MLRAVTFTGILTAAIAASGPAFAIKKAPYETVRVNVAKVFEPDAAFRTMIASLTAATANKNADALFALVGPTFTWTVSGEPHESFDHGRSALDNFKTVFGFRQPDATAKDSAADGPYWEQIAAFAADGTFFAAPESKNLVCGPLLAEAVNAAVFERVEKKLQTPGESILWYFAMVDSVVRAGPEENSATIGRSGVAALPVLNAHPPQDTDNAPKPTHLEVLLPTGKSGWVPAAAMRALETSRLCYAKTANGDWKIAAFEELAE
jgi:hypothetical protein